MASQDGQELLHPMTLDSPLLLHAKLLLLILIANGAPLIGGWFLRQRFNQPVDAGVRFFDGRPVFGTSKTVRGLLLAVVVTYAAAILLDLDALTGVTIALGAMLGDLFSSFIKRRMGLSSSSQALGLDQIPESLFPLLAVKARYGLTGIEIFIMITVFVILELLISKLLFKFRLRDQPY